MRKIKRLCGLFICCCVVVTSSVTAFAAEKVKEPFANLEVVTDKETINEIVSENPRIQKYLDQNEVFADLEIITDQNEIEKILGRKSRCEDTDEVKRILLSRICKRKWCSFKKHTEHFRSN